jgi:ABC-type spermidine/putrescine transport system permease subunit II
MIGAVVAAEIEPRQDRDERCSADRGKEIGKRMFQSVRLETDPMISVVSTLLLVPVLLGSFVTGLARSRSGRAA